MRNTGLFFLVVLLVACASASVPAQAPATKKPPANSDRNSKADEILHQMADYLGKLPAFSCKLEAVLELTRDGQPLPVADAGKNQNNEQPNAPEKGPTNRNATIMSVRLERPNRLAMIVEKGIMGLTVVSDGKTLTQYLPMTRRFVVSPAPEGFEGMTDGAPTSLTMLGTSGGLIPTNTEEFHRGLADGITKSEYLGQEKIGEADCHHLRFIQEEFDWDIWIEVGDRPIPHKIKPDFSKQLEGSGGLKVDYTVSASEWNVAPKFNEADFKFVPPPGAQKADSLFDMPVEPPHALLGQPAPPFVTTDVDGKPIDLQQHLGKNVVMLDFWATWCGPCVQAMPQVDEVAKKFADKGLVFYAVNVGEEAAAVKDFLNNSKMEVPVAMDVDSTISRSYQVQGIPQTLLIGKDGKVQVVHVGFNGQMAKVLAKEIEQLIAGKDLAGETLAKAEEAMRRSNANNPPSEEPPAAEPGNPEPPPQPPSN